MSSKPCFLVIDDEPQIRRAVIHALRSLETPIKEAETGSAGIAFAAAAHPALIVLDLGLPDADGITVCQELRSWSDAAIVVLSARNDEASTVAALNNGADDYITKPFSPTELLARVRAVMRRSRGGSSPTAVIECGELRIDIPNRVVERNGKRVHLTPTEWDLLVALATHAGRVLTHRQLFATVWKGREFGDAQAHLRVHMAHLRRKLESDALRPRHLQTELGVGYRFVL